jgi:intracellular septation protein
VPFEPVVEPPPRKIDPLAKLALELGPLLLFFVAYGRFGIFAATATMMVTVIVTLAISYFWVRRLPIMPLITAVIVLIFGSLTLVLHDESLIKIKPTALYLLFGGALAFGLLFDKPLLKILFDGALNVTPEGWRKLSLRWMLFFFVLAAINEVIWRTQTTDLWVQYKTFGVMPLTLLFAVAQTPLIMKFAAKEPGESTDF